MSLAIFVIAISGIIAMESKSLEAQAAAKYLREGERIAQRLMSQSQAAGFVDLVARDAMGAPGPLPHDDIIGLFSFSDAPADIGAGTMRPGSKPNFYIAGRRVQQVMFDGSVPAGTDASLVDAVTIDVYVLWIDDSNPSYPPPADVLVEDLRLANITAGDPDFAPWVQGVHLRTVRLNDT